MKQLKKTYTVNAKRQHRKKINGGENCSCSHLGSHFFFLNLVDRTECQPSKLCFKSMGAPQVSFDASSFELEVILLHHPTGSYFSEDACPLIEYQLLIGRCS